MEGRYMMHQEEKKTASISADKFRPLEVEWFDYSIKSGMGRFKMMPDGSSKKLSSKQVAFIHPGNISLSRTHILQLNARTALNLLAWLEQEREELQRLARVEALEETDEG